MKGELWLSRNRRTMGLAYEYPFLKRPMNSEEIAYEALSWRLHAYQYESWDRFFQGEITEAIVSSNEVPGSGSKFLMELLKFKDKFPLLK
jgi:hypothetical protein